MRKKIITTIITAIITISAYCLGTAQSKTVTEIKEVEKVVETIPSGYIDTNSNEFVENYVDMRQVTYFEVSEEGLQLYLEDGSGYYWER